MRPSRWFRRSPAGLLVASLLCATPALGADAPPSRPRAAFALVIGANASVDAELARLEYADDDASRYFDLFRSLGARVLVLTRPDDNTRRLHPQAAAEALAPRRAELDQAVSVLAQEVARAKERGMEPILYFVFAGHGGVKNGQGYITLEDARLTGHDLAEGVVTRVGATDTHLIVDACSSYYLAYSRGPGGARRPVSGFGEDVQELGQNPHVGLLLSTSTGRESHEWDAFEAGIFSHEVRSALYGAADANGDGTVTYREVAAFVERANEAVPSARFRPQIYARPPRSSEVLADLRVARTRGIHVPGDASGHYYLESAYGVRLADFHNATGQEVSLLRPVNHAFLRRVDDEREFAIPGGDGVLELASLDAGAPRARPRGAAHESFRYLFALPFGQGAVDAYRPPPTTPPDGPPEQARPRVATVVGLTALGVAAVGAGLGAFFAVKAANLRESPASESQLDVIARNQKIHGANVAAGWSFAGAGAAAVAGGVLLLVPTARPVRVAVGAGRAHLTLEF